MSSQTTSAIMPTSEQIKAYAQQLPDIYRDIFRGLGKLDSNRVEGDNLHIPNPAKLSDQFSDREIYRALVELEDHGFLLYEQALGFITLTNLGEELLATITKTRAKSVPKLPKPTW